MSAATQNEMERLRSERDSAIEQVDYWRERAVAAEGREQALAAHVERLEDIIERSTLADSPAAESALEDTPETSLARLKAQCWKEAYLAGMEAGHHWTVEGGYVAGGDEEAAEDYVADRQAEEE